MATDQAGTTLVVAWRRSSGFDFARVKTAEKFTETLKSVALHIEKQLQQRTGKPYAIGDDLETDEYMTCPLPESSQSDATAIKKHNGPAKTEDPRAFRDRLVSFGGMDPVGANALGNDAIAFYSILRGTTAADRVAYVRHMNPMRLAKPGLIIAGLGDALSKLDSKIFVMDQTADIIIRPDSIDIIDKVFFDGLFFGLSGAGKDLDKIVTATLKSLPVSKSTVTMMIARSRDRKRLRRKVLDIRQSGHLETVTMKEFKAAIDFIGLPKDRFIKKEGGKEVIFVATDDAADDLFYLLNDDLFNGILTRKPWAVSKKHERKAHP